MQRSFRKMPGRQNFLNQDKACQVPTEKKTGTEDCDRDPQATLRCRLLLAFAEGAAAGLVLGQFLLLLQYGMQNTALPVARTLLICIFTGGACGYLLRLFRMLLME